MPVYVAGDKNIRDVSNDEPVLWFGGKWCFTTPLWGQMASPQHFSHRFNRVSVGDGSQSCHEVINGFPMVGKHADTVERKVARVPNEGGRVVVLLNVFLKGGLGFSWSNCIVVSGEHEALYPFREQLQQSSKFGVLGK